MKDTLLSIKRQLSNLQTKVAYFEDDRSVARELVEYIDNTGPLDDEKTGIFKNLILKMRKGSYTSALATRAITSLVEGAARRYVREIARDFDPKAWYSMFPASVRRLAIESVVRTFEEQYAGGELDWIVDGVNLTSKISKQMKITFTDAEGYDVEETVEVPTKRALCPTCDGKGTTVNPAVDSHGISPEEFAEDPDFEEAYFRGDFDVRCRECGGEKVIDNIDWETLEKTDPELAKQVREHEDRRYQMEQETRNEQRWGY
jgi:hypothetical protein